VKIAVDPSQPVSFAVMLRIPGWCTGATVRVNGRQVATDERTRGYFKIRRTWQTKVVIELEMPMPVRQMRSNPLVLANAGHVAIMRGPLMYCLESADNRDSIRMLSIPPGSTFSTEPREDLPGGAIAIKTTGVADTEPQGGLYFASDSGPAKRPETITAIPYFANANRGPVEMGVWIPVEA
jgi:uncharacterized protein